MGIDGYNSKFAEKQRFDRMHERYYRDTRELLKDLTVYNGILDVGCGIKGSLGFIGEMGKDEHGWPIWYVDGLDADHLNPTAKYHDWSEVKGPYDTALFCHILEHLPGGYPEALEQLRSATLVARRFIIVVPNGGENNFIHQRNQDSTHTCTPYNIVDFSVYLEDNGFKVERLIRSGVRGNIGDRLPTRIWIARFLYAFIFGTSPFHDYIIVCQRKK